MQGCGAWASSLVSRKGKVGVEMDFGTSGKHDNVL
jgi:hypothetical protein